MPVGLLHAALWLVPAMTVPPNPDSQDQPESSVAAGVGILVVAAAVTMAIVWIFLRWLSARARRRAESNVTTTSL